MQAVYEAENSIDAHLAKAWLEQAGLSPWVRGEYLGGALGELPAHGVLAVCVPDEQIAAATEAIVALQRRRSVSQDHPAHGSEEGPAPAADDEAWVRV